VHSSDYTRPLAASLYLRRTSGTDQLNLNRPAKNPMARRCATVFESLPAFDHRHWRTGASRHEIRAAAAGHRIEDETCPLLRLRDFGDVDIDISDTNILRSTEATGRITDQNDAPRPCLD